MTTEPDAELLDEDDYDEEADSDFHADGAVDDDASSTSNDENELDGPEKHKKNKRRKTETEPAENGVVFELDSGDEATIKEQKKAKRRQKKKGEDIDEATDREDGEWRARTRAMRERDQDEKKRSRLANIEGSTIDVDKMWEEMNRPGPLPPVRIEDMEVVEKAPTKVQETNVDPNKENVPALASEEMITIKRKFKFAGEVHVEEKIVPRSSAEARLWLSEQEGKPQPTEDTGRATQRPLRKISRFDPNYNNTAAFKINWTRTGPSGELFKGPKLNVVEKSKMDWASHVDAADLKDELDEHAKAKEGYHSRMDFLSEVERRKEEEARHARSKG